MRPSKDGGGYETRPMQPKREQAPKDAPVKSDNDSDSPEPESAATPKFRLGGHKGGGYYYVLDSDGGAVIGDDGEYTLVGKGREDAEKQIEALNAS